MKYLIKSILAGIMIGVGGTIYLSLDNKIVGSLLFSLGLFTIVVRGLNLYTGKIGYVFENKVNYLIELLITLIGNFIGSFIVGFILRYTRIFNIIHEKAVVICDIKLNDSLISIFILSMFCGLLMFLAVNSFRDGKDLINKYIPVFMCVSVFILCGFEHCIANIYYFTVASSFTLKTLGYIGIMILGNSVGSFIFPLCEKITKSL